MPRFTNGKTEIETSNQVEIVRLRASGYTPVQAKSTDEPDPQTDSTDQSTSSDGGQPTGRRRRS